MQPASDDLGAKQRQFTARAAALFTAVALLGILVLAAVGGAGALTYSTLTSERDDLADQRDDLAAEHARLEDRIAGLEASNARLKKANAQLDRRAASSFSYGLDQGREAERERLARAGLTYYDGWKAGRGDALSRSDGWEVGGWYVVRIGEDAHGLRVSARFDRVRACELMYVANDRLHKRGTGC